MVVCNKCNQEIVWKYDYPEYLKMKKANPNFKNIPMNIDGSNHICKIEDTSQPAVKEQFPSADKVDSSIRDIVEAIKELTNEVRRLNEIMEKER